MCARVVRVCREKAAHLVDETGPCGLVLEQDVVAALERNEPRAGNERGELPPLTERSDGVARGMQHERRRSHMWCELAHVEHRRGREQANSHFGRGRDPLQVTEPPLAA